MVGFPPKSSILIGFSIIFTFHFGVSPSCGGTPISPYYPHVQTVHTSLQGNFHFCSLLLAKDSDVVVPSNGVSGSFVHCPEWCSAQRDTWPTNNVEMSRWNFWSLFDLRRRLPVVCSQNSTITRSLALFLQLEKSLEKEKIQPQFQLQKDVRWLEVAQPMEPENLALQSEERYFGFSRLPRQIWWIDVWQTRMGRKGQVDFTVIVGCCSNIYFIYIYIYMWKLVHLNVPSTEVMRKAQDQKHMKVTSSLDLLLQ